MREICVINCKKINEEGDDNVFNYSIHGVKKRAVDSHSEEVAKWQERCLSVNHFKRIF